MAEDLNREALTIWSSLKPIIDKEITEKTRGMVQRRKAKVTTAPTNLLIGVTEPFGSEMMLPFVSNMISATVGDYVWIEWMYGASNAFVSMFANVSNTSSQQGVQYHYHPVTLTPEGQVSQYDSALNYSTVASNLSNQENADYLFVEWGNTKFLSKCAEVVGATEGDIKFVCEVEYNGIKRYMVFTLTPQNVLRTTNILTFEDISNKVQSVALYSASTEKYPSAKAVYDEFQRKPVTVWEVDGTIVTTGLTSIESDLTTSINWQLTGLNLAPYKRVKVYTKAGRKSSGTGVDASNTPATVIEMSLDDRAASPVGGHFCASVIGQKPNDANRMFSVTCAISSDKTSFAVLRMSSIYGTTATGNSDVNGYVFKIEGYYD